MPGTVMVSSGDIRWYNSSVPQRSFVHAFQQSSPSAPTSAEYFALNHAGSGPAYIDQSGNPYYINRNHWAASGGFGRDWWYNISVNNQVRWDLSYEYQHWPNSQEYQVNIVNNNPNDYFIDLSIDDGFSGFSYEAPVVTGGGGTYNVPLLTNRLAFAHAAPNTGFNLTIAVQDITGFGMPGMVDVTIDDADGVSGVLYNSPMNFVTPGGKWDNTGAPAYLPYHIAHNYVIMIN